MLSRVFVIGAFVAALALTGCAEPSSISDTGSENTGSDCKGCAIVRDMVNDVAANSVRANGEYVGKRVQVGGAIKSFGKWGVTFAKLESGSVISPHHPPFRRDVNWKPNRRLGKGEREAWDKWLLSKNVGDVIEAECLILALSVEGPITAYCEQVDE